MLGVILCGGQSVRMGTDKGLLKQHAITWAQTAVEKFNELQLPIVISINKLQVNEYSTIFLQRQLVSDSDSLKIKGPLSGLLSIHIQYPQQDLIILACDMPLMETVVLKELLEFYQQFPENDTYVFAYEGVAEPLCGIYRASGLSAILQKYQTNQLPKHSMKYMLEQVATFSIPLAEDKKKYFLNFNSHAELNGL